MTHSYNLRNALKHKHGDIKTVKTETPLQNPFRRITSLSNRQYELETINISNEYNIVCTDNTATYATQKDVVKIIATANDPSAPYLVKIAMEKNKKNYYKNNLKTIENEFNTSFISLLQQKIRRTLRTNVRPYSEKECIIDISSKQAESLRKWSVYRFNKEWTDEKNGNTNICVLLQDTKLSNGTWKNKCCIPLSFFYFYLL